MTRARKPVRTKPILDPFEHWPEPVGSTSSLTIAANALFRRAEASWTNGKADPWWHIPGAMAHGYDVLEECRKLYGLPLDATPDDVMTVARDRERIVAVVGIERISYVARLLRHATQHEGQLGG